MKGTINEFFEGLRYINPIAWVLFLIIFIPLIIVYPPYRLYGWSNIYNWIFVYYILPNATNEQKISMKKAVDEGAFSFGGLLGNKIKQIVLRQLENQPTKQV